MSDDNGKQNPPTAAPPAFGIVTFHKLVEVPNHGQRLMVAFQVQGPGQVPLSHLMEVPGEVLPVIIQSLQALVDQFPALTKDLCVIGPSQTLTAEEVKAKQPSGIVDASGQPVRGNGKLKLVN